MTQVELLEKVLEAARKAEDEIVDSHMARNQATIAGEHFHRAGGIQYALDLMNDPYYLRKQAEALGVLPKPAAKPKPAPRDIDAETAQILEIERELRKPRVYHPNIEAMRQKGIG